MSLDGMVAESADTDIDATMAVSEGIGSVVAVAAPLSDA